MKNIYSNQHKSQKLLSDMVIMVIIVGVWWMGWEVVGGDGGVEEEGEGSSGKVVVGKKVGVTRRIGGGR